MKTRINFSFLFYVSILINFLLIKITIKIFQRIFFNMKKISHRLKHYNVKQINYFLRQTLICFLIISFCAFKLIPSKFSKTSKVKRSRSHCISMISTNWFLFIPINSSRYLLSSLTSFFSSFFPISLFQIDLNLPFYLRRLRLHSGLISLSV